MAEYKVYVDDNYHFMNREERYLHGTYDTYEKAAAVAKKIIKDFFSNVDTKKLTEEQLFSGWAHYGDNPFIVAVGKTPSESFSASDYVRQLCRKLNKKAQPKNNKDHQ